MLRTTSDYFRQFTCFSAFLVLNGSLLELRGQDKPQGVTASAAAAPAPPSAQTSSPPVQPQRNAVLARPGLFSAVAKGTLPHYVPTSPADPTDPYIVAQAAALNNNPNQIFAFVQNQINFDAYIGSVRGARGTLWAMAGNTLDKASLLVALLDAAGYTAQYEHANINGTTAQANLILSMFPPNTTFVGCLPTTASVSNPVYNSAADQGSIDYYWVQYGTNGTNTIALDPNVPGAAVGQSFQTPDSNFTTVAPNLRQQVTIKVNAELYSQASSLFGGGTGTTTVLTQSFDASALVGNIVSFANLVSTSGGGGLDISSTAFTYTPFLLIGSGGPDVSQDSVITGTPYQELFTNFPLGSSVLTGLFLEVDADDYTGTSQPWTHTVFDRLGPAARQGNVSVNLSLPATPAPALTPFDITTVDITTARQPLSGFTAQQTRLTNAYNAYEAIKAQFLALPSTGPLSDAQQEIQQQVVNLGEYLTVAEDELIAMSYDYTADLIAQQLQTIYFSRVFPNSPRITIASTGFNGGNSQQMLDVLKNDMQVIAGLGQNTQAPIWEENLRGILESLSESQVLNQATGQTSAVGIGEVFGALGNPNLLTVVGPAQGNTTPSNPQALTTTTLSADAQTLILDDVAAGNVVMTPNQMVTVNGVTTVGWWEINPTTGHTISHFVNGGHQAIVEAFAVEAFTNILNGQMTEYIGMMEGESQAGIIFAADVLDGVAAGNLKVTKTLLAQTLAGAPPNQGPVEKFFNEYTSQFIGLGSAALKAFSTPLGSTVFTRFAWNVQGLASGLLTYVPAFIDGFYEGLQGLAANLPADPESLYFVSTPLGLTPATPTPGTTPGVRIGAIAVDPTYTMPLNGNELPLVFDLPITNTGPSTDTFNIQIIGNSYFQLYPTIDSVTLAGGQSGSVNICVAPVDSAGDSLPPVGQSQPYTVNVTSATNSSITATAQPSFNVPPISSLEISTDPASVAAVTGATTPVNLTLASVGNVAPGAVALTASAPTGIALTGLTSPLTVALNGSITDPLSLQVANNMPTGGYQIVIQASYTPSGGTPQVVNYDLPITVTALGSCAVTAATLAGQLSKPTLAADLGALAADMNAAAAAGSPALATRVAGDMNTIINGELTSAYFTSIIPNLTSATNTVANASAATLPAALAALSTAVCSIGTLLNQANTTSTLLRILPTYTLNDGNLAVGPNSTAQWNISINNNSSVLHVYNFTTMGVPAGVTAQFTPSTVTLPPYPSPYSGTASPVLTLTTGATFNQPFSFTVIATPQDAPEFAVSAPGTLLARSESINIDQVTVNPPYTNAGNPITISARLFSVVNETVQATLQASVTDANGNNAGTVNTSVTLTPAASIQTVTLPALSTTNFINGIYTVTLLAQESGVSQGATATGTFLIGSPLSGVLTANPSVVGPGSSTVQASLAISRDTTQNPVSTLVGSVPVNGLPRSMTLFQNGAQQLAYVCSDSQVNIVDVTNTANPNLLSTFANDILTDEDGSAVPGYVVVSCTTYTNQGDNYFLISYSRYDGNTTTNIIPTHFATYSLAKPLAPTPQGSVVDIERPDSAGLYVAGSTALLYESTTTYDPYSFFIEGETGDVWTASLSTPGSLSFLGDVYSCGGMTGGVCNNVTNVPTGTPGGGVCSPGAPYPVPNDPTYGGPYRIGPGAAVNATTTYFASTSASGGNVVAPGCPVISGQLLVVDTTNPSSPTILTQVSVPAMAFMTGVAVQGTTALAVGDSTGGYDIRLGYTGTLVLSSFDISNPRSPVLLNSVVTQLSDTAGSFVVPLGSNTFAVGNTTLNGQAELVLVDASNPNALRYIPYNAAFVANPTIAQNGYFFALSSTPISTQNALSIFQLSEITGPQLSVSLTIPTTGNALLVPGSFNPAPTGNTPGSNSTTYVWTQPVQNNITFNMSLTGVNPGDVTTLVSSGQLNFTLPSLGTGSYSLGSLTVLTQHILSISPASGTVGYGAQTANYTATISNPTNAQVTFTPSVIVPPGWTGVVQPNVVVPANGSQTFNVAVTPPANAQYGATTFNVAASANGISDSVPATLDVSDSGANLGSESSTYFVAFTDSISPSQVTVGQGGNSAPYTLTFTNTGNYAYYIQANPALNLPNGVGINIYVPANYATLSPNAGGSINGTVYANRNTTPGTYPITIPVQGGNTVQDLPLTVVVSSSGVGGYISPSSGATSSNFVLNLTNYGLAQDTFKLSVVGPLAQAASLQPTVTLASGATNPSIAISFDSTNYIIPANTQLQVLAVSQNDPNVQALITATVTVGPAQSVTAEILPNATHVTYPATANLLFDAVNTGNIADTYKAEITGTTGPVTASLVNNGQSVQSILSFYAPARGTAQFPLNAVVSGSATATVTVSVTSLTNLSVTSSALVTINPANQCDVNQDGTVNAQDVQLMIDQALGKASPQYDLNADGVVNVVDVEIDLDAAIGEGCMAAIGALSTATAHVRTISSPSAKVSPAPAGSGAALAAQTYRVTDLGTLGGSFSAARGINNLQQVVGESAIGNSPGHPTRHAFLWDAGYMTDLGPPAIPALDSAAYSINDAGQAAVVLSYPDRHTESFRYAAGTAAPLIHQSSVSAIDNAGELVGSLSASGAFLWNSGTSTYLGTLGGAGSDAYAINDLGQIVGASYLAGNSTRHAFLYDGAALTDLGTLGGADSVAFGINSAGRIVGASQATANGPNHAFLYSERSMTDLGTLGGAASQANAINGSGLVVGWAQTFTGEQHAFLWNSGKMIDLNSLVTLEQGAVLLEATAINGAGQIVANGSNGRAYLITLPAQLP